VFFRPIFALVFIELASRKIMFAATTRVPSQAWVTQQLRNATPFGAAPRFLIRDRDDKFGTAFDALARATGIRMLRIAKLIELSGARDAITRGASARSGAQGGASGHGDRKAARP